MAKVEVSGMPGQGRKRVDIRGKDGAVESSFQVGGNSDEEALKEAALRAAEAAVMILNSLLPKENTQS